jgi:hypothetical protein
MSQLGTLVLCTYQPHSGSITTPVALLRSNLETEPFSRIVFSGAIGPQSLPAQRQSLDRSGSPVDVRAITFDPPITGARIELANE